ncbi:MFS transporter [Vibrio sp. WXL210]|uniref:MFS transporter n=1 Tax=Vibrio sp. WXL210 TaxID=3450709 RepID=UPI003EC8AC91
MWQNRNYVRLLLAQVVSLIGTGVSSVYLALLAYELAGASASQVLSIAFAIKMFAYIVLAPIFSALTYTLNKKHTLIVLDLCRGLTLLFLPLIEQVWQVYLLMFIIFACSAAFTPLYQALLPQVLPDRDDYAKALSYSRVAFDLEQVISPLLTALMLLTISFRTLFLLDAGAFVISAILIKLFSASLIARTLVCVSGSGLSQCHGAC